VIKLFAIAFTCVYLHLSVGVVKTTHYCMGRESTSVLFTFQPEPCACSLFLSNLEKKSCCHDEAQLLVLDDDQTPTFPLLLSNPELYLIANLYNTEIASIGIQGSSKTAVLTTVSPPSPKEPIYKVLCSYTLYEVEALA
jgi:hypothetical protein